MNHRFYLSINQLKKKILSLAIFWGFTLFSLSSVAAPIPVSSSSQLIKEMTGHWFSDKGFALSFADSNWKLIPKPKGFDNIETVFQGSNQHGSQAALTVRVDTLQESQSFKKYVLKSLKDFPRFGFEILASTPIKLNENPAFLIDLYNRGADKQLRQILISKGNQVAILTCRDHREKFNVSLVECQKISKSFRWINSSEENVLN